MDFIRVPPITYSTPPPSRAWDDKGKSNDVQIYISYSEYYITSFQFLYADDNGKMLLSDVHGEVTSSKYSVVTLDYPAEFLTSVSGKFTSNYKVGRSKKVLGAITFGTNKGKYGPFGPTSGKLVTRHGEFEYQFGAPLSTFGGFHGSVTSDCKAVEYIGVYIKNIAAVQKVKKENLGLRI